MAAHQPKELTKLSQPNPGPRPEWSPCTYLQLNVPLPDCAPGEWGPTKAVKLLGLVPLSHLYPVINAAPDENVVLKV